jgi:hypothetical protein
MAGRAGGTALMSRVVEGAALQHLDRSSVPRQDPVLRTERGNKQNAADVKANRALALA